MPHGNALLNDADQQTLLAVARQSLLRGVQSGLPWNPVPGDYSAALRQHGASFVTLRTRAQKLRGCMGSLIPRMPLVADVAKSAFAAGFRDPRFAELAGSELPLIRVSISVPGVLEPVEFHDEAELIRLIGSSRPGLVLRYRDHQATLLPAVWEMIPDPAQFLLTLKTKARLDASFWSPEITIDSYPAQSFSEPAESDPAPPPPSPGP